MFDESNFWNVRDDLKGRSLDQIKNVQKELSLPYAVAVINLNGDLNAGIIIRTAALFGAEQVLVFGRRKIDRRSAVGAHNYITVHRFETLDENGEPDYPRILKIISDGGFTPVLVEQGGRAVRDFVWPSRPCIVLGNESVGLPADLVAKYDTVSIPQRGVLRSLNVSTAAGIIMEHLSYSLS